MKSLFEQMGGTCRQAGDYLIPNLTLPGTGDYQIGKYGRMRCTYLKEHRKVLYTNFVVEGTLFKHLRKSTKPATSEWKLLFQLWRNRRM